MIVFFLSHVPIIGTRRNETATYLIVWQFLLCYNGKGKNMMNPK
nr:MAG TPA: hypothetical protein [Caudoviricetes sp.]